MKTIPTAAKTANFKFGEYRLKIKVENVHVNKVFTNINVCLSAHLNISDS